MGRMSPVKHDERLGGCDIGSVWKNGRPCSAVALSYEAYIDVFKHDKHQRLLFVKISVGPTVEAQCAEPAR